MSACAAGTGTVFDASAIRAPDAARRRACIERLVSDLVRTGGGHLHIETAEGVDAQDRRQLIELLRHRPPGCAVTYRHVHASQEPALAAPDAIGWAWTKGGEWRERARPLVSAVVPV